MAGAVGVEPTPRGLEALVLPLHYAPVGLLLKVLFLFFSFEQYALILVNIVLLVDVSNNEKSSRHYVRYC